jgi:hypothetical protein
VPTDDPAAMNPQTDFERQIREFPGLEHAYKFSSFEKWANSCTNFFRLAPWQRPIRLSGANLRMTSTSLLSELEREPLGHLGMSRGDGRCA